MEMIEEIRAILAAPDWSGVTATDHGAFITIAGKFRGRGHAGSRADWRSLAADLDRIVREQSAPVASPTPVLEGGEMGGRDAEPVWPDLSDKLSDWDTGDEPLTREEAEAEAERILKNIVDGFDVADEISGLSIVRRQELTQALHQKKGAMRRARMTGETPDETEGAIDRLVDLLARRGI